MVTSTMVDITATLMAVTEMEITIMAASTEMVRV